METWVQPWYGLALVGVAGWAISAVRLSAVTCREAAHTGPVSLAVHSSAPVAGSYPPTTPIPALAYTLSVSQEPATWVVLSSLMTGEGTWNSGFALVLAGAFSWGVVASGATPPDVPPVSFPPAVPSPPFSLVSLPSLPPSAELFLLSSSLPMDE